MHLGCLRWIIEPGGVIMKKVLLVLVVLMVAASAVHAVHAQETQAYKVQAGDTLWALAQKYDTTVVKLLDLNPGVTPDRLAVGQELKVPVEAIWSYHVVQRGDSVKSLAAQYRVPVEGIQEANGITGNKLTVGEMIRIPIHLYMGEAEAEPKTHVVEIGETLFGIAKEYKATLGDLVEWNNLKNPDTIFAGQKLIVG